jgi:hypothetical protein
MGTPRREACSLLLSQCPTWFKEDLEQLFGLLAAGTIRPRVAERISSRSPKLIAASRRAGSRASSSCARTCRHAAIACRLGRRQPRLPSKRRIQPCEYHEPASSESQRATGAKFRNQLKLDVIIGTAAAAIARKDDGRVRKLETTKNCSHRRWQLVCRSLGLSRPTDLPTLYNALRPKS